MRHLLLVLSPALLLCPAAQAVDPGPVVAHGWGYSTEDDAGAYVSRGICDAVATGGVAVRTTVTCYLANALDVSRPEATVTSTAPVVAVATIELPTEDRGLWCWKAKATFLDGSVAYYPNRTGYECALL